MGFDEVEPWEAFARLQLYVERVREKEKDATSLYDALLDSEAALMKLLTYMETLPHGKKDLQDPRTYEALYRMHENELRTDIVEF